MLASCLRSARVCLTPLQMEHVHTHFRWNNDSALHRLESDVPFERERFGAFLKRFERLVYCPHSGERDYEIHTEDEQLIGVAFVSGWSPVHRRCRVGITLAERTAWGHGYGRETLELLLHHLFGDLSLHRVTADAFSYNEAWKGLLQAAGFQAEGCQRDYLYRDGRFWDKESFSLLEAEYHARETASGDSLPAWSALRVVPASYTTGVA